MKHKTPKEKAFEKLPAHDKCFIILARMIEQLPYNQHKIEQWILDELGYEFLPDNKKK